MLWLDGPYDRPSGTVLPYTGSKLLLYGQPPHTALEYNPRSYNPATLPWPGLVPPSQGKEKDS